MRALIAGLMLILAPSLVWAGDARMLFFAAANAVTYETTSFEAQTLEGWTKYAADGSFSSTHAYDGTWAYYSAALYIGSDDYLEKTLDCAVGTVSVQLFGTPSQTAYLKIDGTTVDSSELASAWTQLSAPVTAGNHTIRIYLTGTGGGARAWVDYIRVPVP